MKVIIKCKICGFETTSSHMTNHLKKLHNLSTYEYYTKYIDSVEHICLICGKKHDRFHSIHYGMYETCSIKCAYKLANNRMQEYYLKTHGVKNGFQVETIKEKSKQSIVDKYGVDNISKSDIIKNKKIATSNKNWGTDYPLQNKKLQSISKETCRQNWGVDYYTQTQEYKLRMKESGTSNRLNALKNTYLRLYGVENQMQYSAICNKSRLNGLRKKEYKLPSGKSLLLQGYEPQVLDKLLELYNENDILHGYTVVPAIKYIFHEQEKIYFPDFYIPKDNLIIEVKSTYTYYKDLEKNLIKFQAVKNLGYNFKLMIPYNNEILTEGDTNMIIKMYRKDRGVLTGNGDNR